MKLSKLLTAFNAVAPEHLAEPWDKVGLHVGRPDLKVKKGMLCIDLTEAVLDEAIKKGCQLIVAYHPPIFRPIERLTDSDWKQRVIAGLIQHDIAVYSPHTALDAAERGMADWLCAMMFGKTGTWQPITSKATTQPANYKVAVFVPVNEEDKLRVAMSEAGAGQIGNYRECTFSVLGQGGFRPIEGANPTLGQVGQRETVQERRLEMLVPRNKISAVLSAIHLAHSYEEPAIDVYELLPEPIAPAEQVGAGRLVTLKRKTAMKQVIANIQDVLRVPLKVSCKDRSAVQRIAICPGAGGSLFESVHADVYVTGEMQHHHVLDLAQQGRACVLAGHTNTERPYLSAYRELLEHAGAKIPWAISKADRAPMQIV